MLMEHKEVGSSSWGCNEEGGFSPLLSAGPLICGFFGTLMQQCGTSKQCSGFTK